MNEPEVINLHPRETQCHVCGKPLAGCQKSIPFLNGVPVPRDWKGGEWAGFDVCDSCFEKYERGELVPDLELQNLAKKTEDDFAEASEDHYQENSVSPNTVGNPPLLRNFVLSALQDVLRPREEKIAMLEQAARESMVIERVYECLEVLQKAGMGKPGKPNNLVSMVEEACGEIVGLKTKIKELSTLFGRYGELNKRLLVCMTNIATIVAMNQPDRAKRIIAEIEAARKDIDAIDSERRFPILGSAGRRTIAWAEAEKAWAEYDRRYANAQTLEILSARGGLAESELQDLLGYLPEIREG